MVLSSRNAAREQYNSPWVRLVERRRKDENEFKIVRRIDRLPLCLSEADTKSTIAACCSKSPSNPVPNRVRGAPKTLKSFSVWSSRRDSRRFSLGPSARARSRYVCQTSDYLVVSFHIQMRVHHDGLQKPLHTNCPFRADTEEALQKVDLDLADLWSEENH